MIDLDSGDPIEDTFSGKSIMVETVQHFTFKKLSPHFIALVQGDKLLFFKVTPGKNGGATQLFVHPLEGITDKAPQIHVDDRTSTGINEVRVFSSLPGFKKYLNMEPKTTLSRVELELKRHDE